MKLVDADLLSLVVNGLRKKYTERDKLTLDNPDWRKHCDREFEIFNAALDALKEASIPAYTVLYAEHGDWVACSDEMPPAGVDVILTFEDTFHTHPSWPRIAVKPAWICNVGEEKTPNGEWAIEGRLGNFCVPLEAGLGWMPLPKGYVGPKTPAKA